VPATRHAARRVRIGIDTGGTFTDFHVLAGRGSFVLKVPSTPADPAVAFFVGLDRIADRLSATSSASATAASRTGPRARRPDPLADAEVVHGTTVGTNALLTRRTARAAFVTTGGFEDLIEIGRQNRPALYDLSSRRPSPLVPRALRFGLGERTWVGAAVRGEEPSGRGRGRRGSSGTAARSERIAPSQAELKRLARRLKRAGVESVAIGFLNAYFDPRNERAAGRAMRDLGVPITLSHRIAGEYREYERFSTAIANAALQPLMGRYLARVGGGAAPARVAILQSDATTAAASAAGEEPVRTVLSGPAGGALAALGLAERLGEACVLSFDMGGTSTDAVLIDGGLPRVSIGRIGGLPLRTPMIDVRTVGAGGGSIARRDAGGALRVGPESAGADPGPACYGRSDLPTVTDAHIVLGRLGPADLLGGEFPVNAARSRAAIARLGRALGLNPERAAEGILTVVESTMERVLRSVSLEQGRDPRLFTLCGFGGAAGLHVCALAARLGMNRIVIPPAPGVFSATGLASASAGVEAAQTLLAHPEERARIDEAFSRLEKQAQARLERQGRRGADVRFERSADLRFAGQSHELTIPWSARAAQAFVRAHRRRFGYAREGAPIEIVTLRVRAAARDSGGARGADGRVSPLAETPAGRGVAAPVRASAGRRRTEMIVGGRRAVCPVLAREDLRPGAHLDGPARITEYSSTTFVAPGWRARAERAGTLVLTLRGKR
jgi:N-methylhydantoinase A